MGDGAVPRVNQRQSGADGVRQMPRSHRNALSGIRLDDELRRREADEPVVAPHGTSRPARGVSRLPATLSFRLRFHRPRRTRALAARRQGRVLRCLRALVLLQSVLELSNFRQKNPTPAWASGGHYEICSSVICSVMLFFGCNRPLRKGRFPEICRPRA